MLERRERFGEAKHLKNAPFLFKPENWSVFFNKLGWVKKEMKYLPEVALRLKCRVYFDIHLTNWFKCFSFRAVVGNGFN
jgi:hypothetical protein